MATAINSVNWSEFQRAEIAEELAHVLAGPRFATSQRCTALLHHVVALALNDSDHGHVKERTLGIEVFHRDPNYDANADPIVRRIASETRKRLAQHYQDSNHHTIRIRLEAGSYIPHFDFEPDDMFPHNGGTSALANPPAAQDDYEVVHPEQVSSPVSRGFRHRWLFWSGAAFLVFSAVLAAIHSDLFRPTSYLVWEPLLMSKGTLVVCVSDHLPALFSNAVDSARADAAKNSSAVDESSSVLITAASRSRPKFMDMMTAFKISKQLYAFGRNVTLIPSSSLKSENFSNGPIILVGGINYPLSRIAESRLRYSFTSDHPDGARWIQDAQDPSKQIWKVDGTPEHAKVDYAMVTRFWDSDTGGWVMMVCGIGPFGTEAAANLITDPVSSKLLPASLRSARNFQIVLRTIVIDGSAGAPQVLAVYTW